MERQKIKKTDHEITLEKERETKAFATGVVGALSLIILFFGPQVLSEFEITRQHQLIPTYIGLLGLLLFLGMSFESSESFQFLWKYKSMKLLSTIAISYVLIVSGAKSASVINSVFSIDGSSLPYTMALLTPVIFILTIKWIFYCISGWSAFIILEIIGEYRHSGIIKWNSVCFVVSSLLLTGFLYFQSGGSLSDDGLKIKAYKLGHQFDFSNSFDCSSINSDTKNMKSKSVLFLTPDHNQVIVDYRLNIDESFQNFFKDTDIKSYKQIGNFKRVTCNKH